MESPAHRRAPPSSSRLAIAGIPGPTRSQPAHVRLPTPRARRGAPARSWRPRRMRSGRSRRILGRRRPRPELLADKGNGWVRLVGLGARRRRRRCQRRRLRSVSGAGEGPRAGPPRVPPARSDPAPRAIGTPSPTAPGTCRLGGQRSPPRPLARSAGRLGFSRSPPSRLSPWDWPPQTPPVILEPSAPGSPLTPPPPCPGPPPSARWTQRPGLRSTRSPAVSPDGASPGALALLCAPSSPSSAQFPGKAAPQGPRAREDALIGFGKVGTRRRSGSWRALSAWMGDSGVFPALASPLGRVLRCLNLHRASSSGSL